MSEKVKYRVYYCKESKCNNKISLRTALYGEGRCMSCSKKDRRNPAYIDGRTNKIYYCIDCDKKLSYYRYKRCKKCSEKLFSGKNSYRYGKSPVQPRKGKYKNIWMKSSWEILFAQFLSLSRIKWNYEPKVFDLGNTTYTPDFYIPEFNCYIEIKGYWRDDAKEKFDLFKKLYSDKNIEILTKKELRKIGVLNFSNMN